jgi:hypothetical protein
LCIGDASAEAGAARRVVDRATLCVGRPCVRASQKRAWRISPAARALFA